MMGGYRWPAWRTPGTSPGRSLLATVPALAGLLAGGLAVLSSPAPASAQLSPEILNEVNRALGSFEKGEYDEALAEFQAVVEKAKKYEPTPEDYLREAQIRLQQSDVRAALAAADAAMEKDAQSAAPYVLKGHILRLTGDSQAALDCLEKALELEPDNHPAVEELWKLLSENRSFGAAIRIFQKHLEKSNDKLYLTFYLGEAYFASGDYQRAVELYLQALEIDPEQSAFHQRLLAALESKSPKGEPKEAAVTIYRGLLEKHPTPMVKLFLAKLYVQRGEKDQAVALLEELARADVDTIDASLRLAVAEEFAEAERYAEAAEQARRVLALVEPGSAESVDVTFDLGRWLVKAGDLREGLEYLHRALDLFIRTGEEPVATYFQLGNAYWLLRNREKAEYYFRKFDERLEQISSPPDPEALERLGDIYLEDGNGARAVKYLKRVVDWYDSLPQGSAPRDRTDQHRALLKLARAYFVEKSDLNQCVSCAKQVADVPQLRGEARILLARAYLGFDPPQVGNAVEVLQEMEGTPDWSDEAGALLGQALLASKPAEALPYIQRAHQAKPDDEECTLLYVELLVALKQYDEARQLYQQVLKGKPRCARALKGMGSLERRLAEGLPAAERAEHLRVAKKYYEDARQVARSDPEIPLSLADTDRALGTAEGEIEASHQRMATAVQTLVVAVLVGVIAWAAWLLWQTHRASRLFHRVTRLEKHLRDVVRRAARAQWGEHWEQELRNEPFKERFNFGRAQALKDKEKLPDVLEGSYFGELVGIVSEGWKKLGLDRFSNAPGEADRRLILLHLGFLSSWRNIVAHGDFETRAGEHGLQKLDRAKIKTHMDKQIVGSLKHLEASFDLRNVGG